MTANPAPLSPVVAVVGTDELMRADAVRALRAQVVGGGADFNVDTCDPNEEGVQRALGALATLPMLAPRRWVHLRDLQRLPAGSAARLIAYLKQPQAHAVLCLSASKLDMRTQLGRAVQRHAELHQASPPSAGALPGWLVAWAQRHDQPLTYEAAVLLVTLCGSEPGALCRAAERVALFAHPARPVEASHVAAAQATTAPAHIFALGETLARRQWPAASALLRALLSDGQSPILILSLLARHIQQLLVISSLPAAERRAVRLAPRLGVPPGIADKLMRQASDWTTPQLVHGLQRVLAADTQLKVGANAAVRLEAMLWDILAQARPA